MLTQRKAAPPGGQRESHVGGWFDSFDPAEPCCTTDRSRRNRTMDSTKLLDIYRTAVLCREFERRVIQLAMTGEIPASLHPGAGQEVEQIAALAALGPEDKVLYGHRGVAYMIARGTSLAAI